MMPPNYPNHPLFRIAPLLDKGFQTARFDPYEQVLVAKIRAGQYSSDLWDCNSHYLGFPARNFPPPGHVFAAKSRYKMTPEEIAAYNNDPERLAERARRAEERRARRAEIEREEADLAARRRARDEEDQRRAREWEQEQNRRKAARAAAEVERERRQNEQTLARLELEFRRREAAAGERARRAVLWGEEQAQQQQRAQERAARRWAEEQAKPNPDQELLAVFSRWVTLNAHHSPDNST